MNVEKSTTINAPKNTVFNLVNSLREMELWNEWSLSDSTNISSYNDIYSGVGASSSWESEKTGNGTQEIIESIPGSSVKSLLKFGGRDEENFALFNLDGDDAKTEATWSFDGPPLPFLMRGFALITGMKKDMHRNYERGLENLKNIAELRSTGKYDGFEIQKVIQDDKHFIMTRKMVKVAQMTEFYGNNLPSLFAKVQGAGVAMKGMPCGLFFRPENKNQEVDMAAAIPVNEPLSIPETSSFSIPSKASVVLDYYGSYDHLNKGHEALEKYMRDRNLFQDAPYIEEYVSDPGVVTDESKQLTKITYYYTAQ